MVKLKYVGTHQPVGMIIDVDEDRAKELLISNEYERADVKKKIIEVKKHDDSE